MNGDQCSGSRPRRVVVATRRGHGSAGCPSVYLSADGSLIAQGQLVDTDTHDHLKNVLPGEGAMHIAPEVVIDALARYQRPST